MSRALHAIRATNGVCRRCRRRDRQSVSARIDEQKTKDADSGGADGIRADRLEERIPTRTIYIIGQRLDADHHTSCRLHRAVFHTGRHANRTERSEVNKGNVHQKSALKRRAADQIRLRLPPAQRSSWR